MSEPIETADYVATPRSARPATARESGLAASTLLLLLGWPLVVAGAAGYWLDQRNADRLADALADRRPVVVLNEGDFIRKARSSGAPETTVAAGLQAADQMAERLAQAGYIVIKDASVVRAAAEARVTP